MGTRFVRTTSRYVSVTTTRYLLIPTDTTTQIYITTGYTAIRIYNSGTNTLIWGDTTIVTNSGNFLFSSASKEWEDVSDNFNFYMVADSANSYITITESLYA